jgi:hypothetical protein
VIREDRPPYPHRGRLWDHTLTGIQRLRRVDFLLGLGLDPARVPDGAGIDHDPRTDEYRVQIIGRGGQLVWVRRLWSPPAAGPRRFGPISAELAALREFYGTGHQLAHRAPAHLLAAFRDAPQRPSVSGLRRGQSAEVTIVDDPVITYDPGRVADTLEATAARYGLARERVAVMRGRGA